MSAIYFGKLNMSFPNYFWNRIYESSENIFGTIYSGKKNWIYVAGKISGGVNSYSIRRC